MWKQRLLCNAFSEGLQEVFPEQPELDVQVVIDAGECSDVPVSPQVNWFILQICHHGLDLKQRIVVLFKSDDNVVNRKSCNGNIP